MLPCHIVRDLLPSYLEHLTGAETEADICEHLESCPDCRAARDAMNGADPSGGAIYYFNPNTATSNWIWSRPLIKIIGKHRFCS